MTTTRLRSVQLWAVVCVTAMSVTASAQQTTSAPQPVQSAQVATYVVGQAKPPEQPGAPAKDLTLEQAQQIALENNLDLKSARLNPAIQDYVLQGFRAAYKPTFTGTYSYNNSAQPATSTLDVGAGLTRLVTQRQNYNTGFSQSTPWNGMSLSGSFSNSRTASNSTFSTKNPTFTSGLSISVTQPLLRNFAIDSNRNRLRTQQVTRQITDITLLQTIENTKASVRAAYWALRQAIESIEINKRSLELATRQYEDNKQKVEIGVMASIDQVTSETQMVNAELALLSAQNAWRQAELALKRLLVSGTGDELYRSTINPVDQVNIGPEPTIDLPGAIQTALANRTDLEVSRRNIENSLLNLEVTKNALKPDLNLTGGYSLAGAGGPILTNGVVTTPGGYSDAFIQTVNLTNPTWNFQFQFSYPLGMASAKASLAQAQLSLEQAKTSVEAQKLTVSTDVTNAALSVQSAYAQWQGSKKASDVAQRNAEAEQTKFDNGMSNNYNVATAQNNLTSARLNELRAMITYVNAVADFEKKQRIGG